MEIPWEILDGTSQLTSDFFHTFMKEGEKVWE